jgi:hypothetical protein
LPRPGDRDNTAGCEPHSVIIEKGSAYILDDSLQGVWAAYYKSCHQYGDGHIYPELEHLQGQATYCYAVKRKNMQQMDSFLASSLSLQAQRIQLSKLCNPCYYVVESAIERCRNGGTWKCPTGHHSLARSQLVRRDRQGRYRIYYGVGVFDLRSEEQYDLTTP